MPNAQHNVIKTQLYYVPWYWNNESQRIMKNHDEIGTKIWERQVFAQD